MSVSKELLERYHLDACSAEECKQIEEWLFNNEVDKLELPAAIDKKIHKEAMWSEIQSVLPPDPQVKKIRSNNYYVWKGAIAASLLFAVAGSLAYFLFPEKAEFVNLNNSSAAEVRQVSSTGYSVSISPNTVASINDELHVIDLKGCILLSSKKDVELLFKGTDQKIKFKKGETYIIFKNIDNPKDIIMVNKQNLFDLPPVMQRQITTHFDI